MGFFTSRWQKEHFIPRDPEIDMHARSDHPVQGDLLVWSDDYGKMIPASPPIAPDIADTIADGDLIVWNGTTEQLEPLTPTFDLTDVGTVADEFLLWNTGNAAWEPSGIAYLAPAYGGLSVAGSVVTQAVTSTAAKLELFDTNDPAALVTTDHTTDTLTITEDGTYKVDFSVAYSHAAATTVLFGIRIDGVGTAYQMLGAADDTLSINGILQLVAGEVITVFVSNNAGGDGNLTVSDAQLILNRLGA